MNVSVIIPAHNVADTITETLQSLLFQSFPDWEAIIIDDGSTDNTASIGESFTRLDTRFRLIRQKSMGVSLARNNGVTQARFDWLLFLDADDWIFPPHLERLTDALKADPGLDAVYCGWTYVTPAGEQIFGAFAGPAGDLFVEHAQYCLSAIHTYLIRRSLVETVGGFDPSLRIGEDWDLWQRIARTGARFGAVREKLAAYRIRSGSAVSNGPRLMSDGLRVLEQGHALDARVPTPHPIYPKGLPREQLTKHKFGLLSEAAGYMIGQGLSACTLLQALENERCPNLCPYEVAEGIFISAMVSAARPQTEWDRLWSGLEPSLQDFLAALEVHSGKRWFAYWAKWFVKCFLVRYTKGTGLKHRLSVFLAWLMLEGYKQFKKISSRVYMVRTLVEKIEFYPNR